VAELRDHNNYLRHQLEVWQEEARRKDHIIAALTERIPELEAPEERSESPETSSASAEGVEAPEEEKRPWWVRLFGGWEESSRWRVERLLIVVVLIVILVLVLGGTNSIDQVLNTLVLILEAFLQFLVRVVELLVDLIESI
jgi:hypothetical protein